MLAQYTKPSYGLGGIGDIKPAFKPNWISVTCFQLVYSMVNTGMGLFVLPVEAERLNSGSASVWLGIYLTVCGLTQAICPVVGKLSDRHPSKYGRRRPFIVGGTAGAVLAIAAMRMASLMYWPKMYLLFLFIGETCLNIAFAAQCGLPADVQAMMKGHSTYISLEDNNDGVKGIVSGYVAVHSFLGSIIVMVMIFLTRNDSVQPMYLVYMFSLIVACVLVCTSVREMPTGHLAGSFGFQPLTYKDVSASYKIDLNEDLNFFWVCAGRAFYYVSTSGVVFLYYYIRDMVIIGDEAGVRSHLAALVILAQLTGAALAIPCSRMSNKIGRKIVIYGANALMATTFVLYTAAPKFGSFAWLVVLFAGSLYGIGSGAYLSVDYALALDCMPVTKTTAEAFGLWGVAGFLGSTIGPLLGGMILSASALSAPKMRMWLGTVPGEATAEYPYFGYALVLLCTGSLMNVFTAVLTSRITGACS